MGRSIDRGSGVLSECDVTRRVAHGVGGAAASSTAVSQVHPIRVSPHRGVISISAYAYRDCDIGPYNEVSISVPFTLDRSVSWFAALGGRGVGEPHTFILHLPVTTVIARAAGVEFAGYPKFLAEIAFEKTSDWLTCRLSDEGRYILNLSGRRVDLRPAPRARTHVFTERNGRLLRSEAITSERDTGTSRRRRDARRELGDHPIAEELRALRLGRAIAVGIAPSHQVILTPVLEGLAV